MKNGIPARPVVLGALLTLAVLPVRLPAQEPLQLLPDLVPLSSTLLDNQIDRRRNGRVYLRLSSSIANTGDGPIEVRGQRRGRTMPAIQRIYASDGSSTDVPFAAFEYHPLHKHWHLLQVAQYRLRDASGQVVATSNKVSFCLADEEHLFAELPGSPPEASYEGCAKSRNARRLRAGISVGWVDTYEKTKAGQLIEITNLPAGDYTLESEVNPDGVLTEKTRENNLASVTITLP
jgi:hypothetical protein